MAFELDIGFVSLAGRKGINEDFCAAMLPQPGEEDMGSIVASQTARALGRLHRQCVIHRDIKPANLHQGDDGVLRVLDLGVALSGREPAAGDTADPARPDGALENRAGCVGAV